MCYIDGQKNKYSVLNECSRMLKYNILQLHRRKSGKNGPLRGENMAMKRRDPN
jgi:hypothetical protein